MNHAAEPLPAPAPVASLPMYDLPEAREATDELWRAIASGLARRGVEAPAALDRSGASPAALWRRPGLLLSQTCGYPLMSAHRDDLTVLATPAYRAAGCEGAFHRAAIIVRASSPVQTLGELRGARCAVNDMASNTGMNLLRADVSRWAGGRPFFRDVVVTGSHAMSLWQVAEGDADVASIDAVTLALLRLHRGPIARRVRILGWTSASPGLPFVTHRRRSRAEVLALRAVLAEVAEAPDLRAAREALLLEGFVELPKDAYASITALAQEAANRGYAELR